MDTLDFARWANTFEGLTRSCEHATDLCDGIILREIMLKISPHHFEFEIGTDRVTNMRNLCTGIERQGADAGPS